MQSQRCYVENVIRCSSSPLASVLLAQREQGELNRIRIRKQTKCAYNPPPDGQKVRAEHVARLRSARVSALNSLSLGHCGQMFSQLVSG